MVPLASLWTVVNNKVNIKKQWFCCPCNIIDDKHLLKKKIVAVYIEERADNKFLACLHTPYFQNGGQ